MCCEFLWPVNSWLQSTQGERTNGKCHCSTEPQSKTQSHKLFYPFAPTHYWSLRNTESHYLTKNPPQRCTYRHCPQQATTATHCRHTQNGHHGQCHHHQYKRNRATHNARQYPFGNHTGQPQTYCDTNAHQTTNASHLTASRENASGQ